jgi:hypothetical protein
MGMVVLERTARLLVDGSNRMELYEHERLRALHVIFLGLLSRGHVGTLEVHNILDGK